jgi:galactose mutarotase-like enzyme
MFFAGRFWNADFVRHGCPVVTMKALSNQMKARREQGFTVYTLSNQAVEIAVVPELGAKIISLKSQRTGREWMWHPAGGLTLFKNSAGDDFSLSPLVGTDECLPTIGPCVWRDRQLPDHGEVWNARWAVDEEAWRKGILKTSLRLEISPFHFERTIELDEDGVRLGYQLSNRSSTAEYFLWALHPLLTVREGDRLILPDSTRALLGGADWIDALDTAIPENKCSKLFAGPLKEGFAGIHNPKTGERLEFEWNTGENNTLGLWLTRGGWHGHHHFAIEPTNGNRDGLTAAVARKGCGSIPGFGIKTWQVHWRIF